MKMWQKILTVCISGALVWGLSFASSIWSAYAIVFASFATGITALCSIVTGYPPKQWVVNDK